ncbi:hypothetical protein [Methylovirgula sp. 4M-Z18]|nr:hypothetical protein [Methylovirgula sp. 4M-Z18]
MANPLGGSGLRIGRHAKSLIAQGQSKVVKILQRSNFAAAQQAILH